MTPIYQDIGNKTPNKVVHRLRMASLVTTVSIAIGFAASCKPDTVVIPNPDRSEQKPAEEKETRFPPNTDQKKVETETKRRPTTEGTEAITTTETVTFEEYRQGMQLATRFDLSSPVSYKVFQRGSNNFGSIEVSLDASSSSATSLRVRVVNEESGNTVTDWSGFNILPNQTRIAVSIETPGGGWYQVETIFYDENKKIVGREVVEKVGVGEVFVVAGQSNSTNCGETPIRTSTGLVVSTDGRRWQLGNDPQIGTHDFSFCSGGSSWPAAGDELVKSLKVPVAFASTGYSGTSVQEWLPGGSKQLFEFTVQRMKQIGKDNFRAVLWHQGETDVALETPQATYYSRMNTIITQSQSELNWQMPWVVAEAAWCRQIQSYNKPNIEPQILGAQRQLANNISTVFLGPNTDQFDFAFRSTNCHFNQRGLIASGEAWARSILNYIN